LKEYLTNGGETWIQESAVNVINKQNLQDKKNSLNPTKIVLKFQE
jgi:hypothetical protein